MSEADYPKILQDTPSVNSRKSSSLQVQDLFPASLICIWQHTILTTWLPWWSWLPWWYWIVLVIWTPILPLPSGERVGVRGLQIKQTLSPPKRYLIYMSDFFRFLSVYSFFVCLFLSINFKKNLYKNYSLSIKCILIFIGFHFLSFLAVAGIQKSYYYWIPAFAGMTCGYY